MTVSELEYASLSPHLFINVVKRYDGTRDRVACRTRIFDGRRILAPGRAPEPIFDVDSMYLVPGGRYLIASGGDDVRTFLCLWDIGYGAHAPMKVLPLTIWEEAQPPRTGPLLNIEEISIKAVAPSSDGKGLVVVVVKRVNVSVVQVPER